MLAHLRPVLVVAAAFVLAWPAGAAAQSDDLASALGGLSWGATSDDILSWHRESILEDYRTNIAGLNDPIEIDRIRRGSDEDYDEVADSLETFDTTRTGYEVSVIQGEIVGGRGQSMITVREDVTTKYYVLTGDTLSKMIVVYDLESLNYMGFEGFVERLEQLFGRPESSDYEEDDLGIRQLVRASWSDTVTRLRVEDRSDMFASYILVYTDASRDDLTVDVSAVRSSTRPSSGRNLGDLVNRLESEGSSSGGNEDVVDQILGTRTEVDLNLGRNADNATDEGEPGDPTTASALDDDEDLDDAEPLERPTRPTRPSGTTTTDDGEDDDDGVVIY